VDYPNKPVDYPKRSSEGIGRSSASHQQVLQDKFICFEWTIQRNQWTIQKGHQQVINKSSTSHYKVINVLSGLSKETNGLSKKVINKSSKGHQKVINKSSTSHQKVINKSSTSFLQEKIICFERNIQQMTELSKNDKSNQNEKVTFS